MKQKQTFSEWLSRDEEKYLSFWNGNAVREDSNCYSYALNCPFVFYDKLYPYPGQFTLPVSNDIHNYTKSYAPIMKEALISDGCIFASAKNNPPKDIKGHYKITALSTQLHGGPDYHFFRQHPDGRWSHQNGKGNKIWFIKREFKTAADFMRYYNEDSEFTGWFYVPNEGIDLSINKITYEINNQNPEILNEAGLSDEFIQLRLNLHKKTKNLKNNVKNHNVFTLSKEYSQLIKEHNSLNESKEENTNKIKTAYQKIKALQAPSNQTQRNIFQKAIHYFNEKTNRKLVYYKPQQFHYIVR